MLPLQGQYYNGRPQLSGKVGPKSGLAFCIFQGNPQVRIFTQMVWQTAACCPTQMLSAGRAETPLVSPFQSCCGTLGGEHAAPHCGNLSFSHSVP